MESPTVWPNVWAVVLNYEGAAVLSECLESLKKQDYLNIKILVVDNASTDGSDEIAERMDGVELKRNTENLMFSGGNNIGIRYAIASGADYIVLINNDTICNTNLVREMVAILEANKDAGIAGPKIYYHETPDVIWSAGGLVDFTRGIVRHRGIRQRDEGIFDEPVAVDYVTGCCLMFRKDVFQAIGGLDESFPMYFEDTDFCTRARKAGFRVIYAPEGRMWHKISHSSGGEFTFKKMWRRSKAGFIFFRRHSSFAQLAVMPFWQLVEFFRVMGLLIRRRLSPGSID